MLLLVILVCFPAAAQQDHPVLRLLIFGSDAQPIRTDKPEGVDDAAVPALATPAARLVTAAFLGRPLDDALLAEIRNRLDSYYAAIARPFVSIETPDQDVDDGTLRVNVIEMKTGRVRVEGNHWFDDQQYLSAIRLRPGDPVNTNTLAEDTSWINRGGHQHATIAVEPGVDPSTYDLAVRAEDSRPLDVTLAADNTGTADGTGLYRIGLAADWSNALWRGDDLNYVFRTSPDQFRLLQNTLSYTAYLPWRDWVTISAENSLKWAPRTGPLPDLSTTGDANIISFRYGMALPSSSDFMQHIDAGYDFKSTNSNVLTGGSSVFPTTSELDQFVLAYTFRRNDTSALTGATVELVGSPGHLTPGNTAAALGAQQPGASPSYVYGRLSAERLTSLPFETAWRAMITAQYSSDKLLESEQLQFGGVQSIRGFEEFAATRDEGVLMQNELRLAALKPGLFAGQTDTEALVPFVFLDLGAGRNHLDLAGVQHSWLEMVSAGPGLTWQFAPNIALRLSWGLPIIRNGHTGPLLGPQFGTQITF
ncbi:MAG: ShlB/FhaC/HecB family hemolysin secretion/activation protein [Rhodopila sp.]